MTSVGLADTQSLKNDYRIHSVALPNSVTKLSADGFALMPLLESITGLEGVQEVEYSCFQGSGLRELAFSSQLRTIGSHAFLSTDLEFLTIPDHVQMDNTSLKNMAKLHSITLIPSSTPRYMLVDGALYTVDRATLVHYPANISQKYVVPEGVKTIGAAAFGASSSSLLEEIWLPDSVTLIEDGGDGLNPEYLNIYVNKGSYAERLFAAHPYARVYVVSPEHPEGLRQERLALDPGENVTEDLFSYTVTEGRALITGYFGTEESITIPSQVDGNPVHSVCLYRRNRTPSANLSVKTITIPLSVTVLEC